MTQTLVFQIEFSTSLPSFRPLSISLGQAGAVRLGISKALLAFPGSHGDQLEREGLLVRDPRMVERKKPGQKKARKKFAWSVPSWNAGGHVTSNPFLPTAG